MSFLGALQGEIEKCLFKHFELLENIFARSRIETRVLSDFYLFFPHSAHHKGRDEHDPPGRNDHKGINFHGQVLIIEIRQANG